MKKTITILSCVLLLGSVVKAQTALPTIPNYVSRNGLVGWWEFSGNAGDSSGKGNHGTVSGNVALTPDRKGIANSAYYFNGTGTGNLINVSDHPSLRVNRLTMSAWVFMLSTSATPQNQVIYKGDYADAHSEAYSMNMRLESGVKINSGCVAGQGWKSAYFNMTAPLITWVHLCTTFDGDSLRNYYNGVLANKVAVLGKIDSCTGSDLRFGFNHVLYQNGNSFYGSLDDIGIWNRALSDTEVKALYTGVPVPNSIAEIAAIEYFSLYPNPGRYPVTITRKKNISAGEPLQITVTDITGRVLLKETFVSVQKELNLESAVRGLYVVTISNTKGITLFREKLVVE